jgi:hypothetical protein
MAPEGFDWLAGELLSEIARQSNMAAHSCWYLEYVKQVYAGWREPPRTLKAG